VGALIHRALWAWALIIIVGILSKKIIIVGKDWSVQPQEWNSCINIFHLH
jgi:hypothetical protein